MKPFSFCRLAGIPLLITLVGASQGFAQLTWDSTGSATVDPVVTPVDGVGNWLDAGKWWDGTNHVTWDNLANATTTAIFGSGGTSGDINLGTGVSAGGLRFNSLATGKGYQFLTGGTLTLNPNAVIDIYGGSSGSGPDNRIRFQNILAGSNVTITNANDTTSHASYLLLSGANTWTGKLTLTGYTGTNSGGLFVNVRNEASLSSLTEIEIKPSTTLSMEASGAVIPSTTTLRLSGDGLGGRGAIRADQSFTINSNIILAGATRLGTNATSSVVVTINGNITGSNQNLRLDNDSDAMAGRYVFKGIANNYGTLTVVKGNAQIGEGGVGTTGNGTLNLSGTTAVVSGTGTTRGFLVNNGTIRPGDNGGVDRGVLNVNGNMNFTGLSGLTAPRTVVEFGLAAPTAVSDKINVTGNLRLHANGNIVVAFEGYSPLLGDSWTLFDYDGTLTMEGSTTVFSLGTNMRSGANDGSEGNLDLPDISNTGYVWSINAPATNGQLTIMVVVPEPATATMAGAAALLLLRRRRR